MTNHAARTVSNAMTFYVENNDNPAENKISPSRVVQGHCANCSQQATEHHVRADNAHVAYHVISFYT